jgi:hypothetical protein
VSNTIYLNYLNTPIIYFYFILLHGVGILFFSKAYEFFFILCLNNDFKHNNDDEFIYLKSELNKGKSSCKYMYSI